MVKTFNNKNFMVEVIWFLITIYFPSIRRNALPENLVQACFQQVKTVYVPKKPEIIPPIPDIENMTTQVMTTVAMVMNTTNETAEKPIEMVRELQFQDGTNVLGQYLSIYVWI